MNCLHVPKILLPKEGIDLSKWAVIACDQFTSQKEYWEETERIVGDLPSTLHLILPEVYLGAADEEKRVCNIHKNMDDYLSEGVLQPLDRGFVLVERGIQKEHARNGLVVEVDLETYEYKKGARSLIRPTEMTVEERIPPRLRVRQQATLELPHIMLLIDDKERTVIEPLMAKREQYKVLYDTKLMQNGGHLKGWFIPEGEETDQIMSRVEALTKEQVNLAVGDGNHSMATAKAAWENIKANLSEEEKQTHPARYCLCEIVNIHDDSLEIEPIHRVLFHVDEKELLQEALDYFKDMGAECKIENVTQYREPAATKKMHQFTICSETGMKLMTVTTPQTGIAVAGIQSFLDAYLKVHTDTKIDYIHGKDVVEQLGCQKGNMGFFLPDIKKEDLFIGVMKDGVLPRKTFSMGEANEKRYYMECKQIG